MNRKTIEKVLGFLLVGFVMKNELAPVIFTQPTNGKRYLSIASIQPEEKKQSLADETFDFLGTYSVEFSGGSTTSTLFFRLIPFF